MATPTPNDRLLARMDVPDCDCPVILSCPCGQSCTGPAAQSCPHCREECDCKPLLWQDPCHHARAKSHGLSVEEWAEMGQLLDPDRYCDPPEPLTAALALSREARVEVMRQRRERKEGLYHPGDLWRTQATDDGVRAGVEATRGRNGADTDGEIRRAA